MKVRIIYTVEVSDDFRRALREMYGESGLASREEVQSHYRSHGHSMDDDLMFEHEEESGGGEYVD